MKVWHLCHTMNCISYFNFSNGLHAIVDEHLIEDILNYPVDIPQLMTSICWTLYKLLFVENPKDNF